MTRILVITNMYPPHHLGGYELSCMDVTERFRARGQEVTVLTTSMRLRDVADPPAERAHGVRRDLSFYWDDHRIVTPSLRRRIAMERENQAALRRAIEDTKPDVVSAWNMGAMSLGLLTSVVEAAIPLVLTICDEWPIYAPRIDAWTRAFARRRLLAALARRITGLPTTLADLGADAAFLYISDTIRSRVEQDSPWRPRIGAVVYNGYDSRVFPISPPPDKPWGWRLLYAGRIDERKGIHVAIEALTHMPNATLDIDGRGDTAYLARLEDLVRARGLGGRVRFAISPRPLLRERYRDADAVVFPTIWEEPFGLVPVEAMACGIPVVATGTGGSGEFLVDGVNCLRVEPKDAAAIAAAVRRLAEDPALRRKLTEGGSRAAQELTVDRFADVMEAWHVAAAERFRSGVPAPRRLAIA